MTLVLDAAPLVALADRADPRRDEVAAMLSGERGKLVIPAPVTAEVDYMLGRFFGRPARRAFLADLAAGRYEVVSLDAADHATVIELSPATRISISALPTARWWSQPTAAAPTGYSASTSGTCAR